MKRIRGFFYNNCGKLVVACLVALTMTACGTGIQTTTKPFNRIIFIIDTSSSFADKVDEAVDKGKKLINAIHAQQERRWEIPDEIYIITLDAGPCVIWNGNRPQLEQLKPEKIAELVESRKPYTYATDVVGAFNLAGEKFMRKPEPTGKYLVVFSDLIDEPPLPGGGCKPPKRPSAPHEDIQWGNLQDVSITVFWPSDKEIQAWEKVLAPQNLTIQFFDEAESINQQVKAPLKAQRQQSPEEIEQAKKNLLRFKNIVFSAVKWTLIITVLGFIGLFASARYFRTRQRGSG